MGYVTLYNKKLDTTYVYESQSYYDPGKKQSRSRRQLVGKLDKETGEVIPTGQRGAPRKKVAPEEKEAAAADVQMAERIRGQEKELALLKDRVERLEEENRKLREQNTELGRLRKENSSLTGTLAKIRDLAEREIPG